MSTLSRNLELTFGRDSYYDIWLFLESKRYMVGTSVVVAGVGLEGQNESKVWTGRNSWLNVFDTLLTQVGFK